MFLHSRMWLGLPVAAVAAFVVIFLLRRFGEGLPTAEAFWKGAVYDCFLLGFGRVGRRRARTVR